MSSGIFFLGLTCNYYADLIEEAIKSGLPIKTVAISEALEGFGHSISNGPQAKRRILAFPWGGQQEGYLPQA